MSSFNKQMFKKSPEELQLWLHFKKRGFRIENKKGRGSYVRKQKHRYARFEDNQ